MARVIAIANHKGGVGKTTTAVHLAAGLAHTGRRVLLCDVDPKANAACALGLVRPGLPPLKGLVDDEAPAPRPLASAIERLEILAAAPGLTDMEPLIWRREDRFERLRKVLAALGDRYDIVLIDLPPSLGLIACNALAAADSAILPVQCEFFAMEGLALLLDTVRTIKKRVNPSLRLGGLLLTLYDHTLALHREVAAEIRAFFRDQVLRTVIPRDISVVEAASHGLDLLRYRPAARASWAYVELTREVLEHERNDEAIGTRT